MKSVGQDTRRTTMKEPLAPATKGLKQTMQKLGVITRKHEALVKRVDELEASFPFVIFSVETLVIIILRIVLALEKIAVSENIGYHFLMLEAKDWTKISSTIR